MPAPVTKFHVCFHTPRRPSQTITLLQPRQWPALNWAFAPDILPQNVCLTPRYFGAEVIVGAEGHFWTLHVPWQLCSRHRIPVASLLAAN